MWLCFVWLFDLTRFYQICLIKGIQWIRLLLKTLSLKHFPQNYSYVRNSHKFLVKEITVLPLIIELVSTLVFGQTKVGMWTLASGQMAYVARQTSQFWEFI